MSHDSDQFRNRRRSFFYPKADIGAPDDWLRALPTIDTAGLQRQAAEAYARHFSLEPAAVVPLGQHGTFHRLFRVSSPAGPAAIARLCVVNGIEHEYLLYLDDWIHRQLTAASMPALRVFAVEPSSRQRPHACQLLEEAPGAPLSRCDDDEARMTGLLAQLGRFLARLHGIATRGYGLLDASPLAAGEQREVRGLWASWPGYLATNFESHLERCTAIGAIDTTEARRAEHAFAAGCSQLGEIQPVLLHGDLGNHNVFTEAGEITALVDWEDCLSGDAVFDLAFWATFHPQRRHRALLAGYQAATDLPPDFEQRFWLYFLRVALAKTVLRDRFGLHDRPGRPPAARRIHIALGQLEACLELGRVPLDSRSVETV